MNILLSNDDGVFAPGIQALYTELSTIANVTVMAPDRNRSGASNSLTLHNPLRVKTLDNGFHSVDGTPTDCVHLALTGYLDTPFDIVLSGVNAGANLSDDILYSGTVAAAMEGRYLGLPAIAVSLLGDDPKHFATASVIAKQLVLNLSRQPLPSKTILNVNVPDLPLEEIQGLAVTRLGARHASAPMIKETEPRGKPIYWIGPSGMEADAGPGTDFFAVAGGHVSVTPLHLDMTHHALMDPVSHWMEEVTWAL